MMFLTERMVRQGGMLVGCGARQSSVALLLVLGATATAAYQLSSSPRAFAPGCLQWPRGGRTAKHPLALKMAAPALSTSRRAICQMLLGACLSAAAPRECPAFEWVPKSPEEGDCADCIGERGQLSRAARSLRMRFCLALDTNTAYLVAPSFQCVLPSRAGVTNGFLANCPEASPTCVSSQDDQGPTADWANSYAEPWIYEGSPAQALAKIKFQVQRFGGKVVKQTDDYMRCEFRSQSLPGQVDAFDDTEFYLTPNDATVQFRSARRPSKLTSSPLGDFGANKKRMEDMRVALHWEKVPVLRNRKRAFLFFESPLDTFGPACNGIGCGEDLESTDDLKRPQRFDTDPLSAPALPRPPQPDEDEE